MCIPRETVNSLGLSVGYSYLFQRTIMRTYYTLYYLRLLNTIYVIKLQLD